MNAKNVIFNNKGFSPWLVLGQYPNLPSVMTDHIPAVEGAATNERVVMHLNALHAARQAYIKAETSDWIRRASRHNVRITNETYQPGDKVFFQCQDSNRLHRPAKVIGQDCKVVFVKNGDQLVRVSRCRIVKFGSEFQAKDQNCSIIYLELACLTDHQS